ncbi:unnamed protein product [Bemisia tabaci]|uniref:Cytochrome P450 n=1 Tax=Bemisia tabaci TaxID=7038 RepID=A0A9P0A1V0_BEMTA|nr:unnamed protein product [Bemisia tabaci]
MLLPGERMGWTLTDLSLVLLVAVILIIAEYKSWSSHWSFINIYRILGKGTKVLKEPKTIKDVPGPVALPVFGTRWLYSVGGYKMNKIHELYADLFRKYGETVREEALWNFPVINIRNRDDIERVLKQSSKFPIRPPNEVTSYYRRTRPDKYTNLGLVNEQGQTWHDLRTKLTPALTSSKTMTQFLPELNQVADDFNTLITNSRDENGVVHNFEEYANRMGLESTCTLILGERLGFLEQNISPVASRLADAVKGQFIASRDTFYGLPFWKILPTPAYKRLVESEDTIYEIISEMVDKTLKAETNKCAVDPVQSVFMSILQAEGMELCDKKAAIIDFIAAGIKTLGNTLVFLLYLVAKHPEVQEKIYEELEGLVTDGCPLSTSTLRHATYLKACIAEAFRVLPTAPCVARILESETELSSYLLPAGSVVLCHTWLASQEECNFVDAKSFKPERWLDNSAVRYPFLVCPFGVGKRMCPGKRFVELELQVVLAQTVRKFHIDFDEELDLQFEFLLAPKSPTNIILRDRH